MLKATPIPSTKSAMARLAMNIFGVVRRRCVLQIAIKVSEFPATIDINIRLKKNGNIMSVTGLYIYIFSMDELPFLSFLKFILKDFVQTDLKL